MMRLAFSDKVYGRDIEAQELLKAVERIRSAACPVHSVLVYGASGCGKTRLCDVVKDRCSVSQDIYFIRGKFDQYEDGSVPYSGIAQAVEDLVRILTESATNHNSRSNNDEENDDETIATALREGLAYEGRMLTKLVTGLQDMLGEQQDTDSSSENMSFSSIRMAVALSSFFERFCSPDRPVVLCIDDVQFADPDSLSLLQHLMVSEKLSNLLFLGSIRSDDGNSSSSSDILSTFLDMPNTTPLHLENLSLDKLNLWISELLGATREDTLPLSKVCLRKTLGNPYFTQQFLKVLETKGFLKFDVLTARWRWESSDLVFQTDVAHNVVQALTSRIQTLPASVRRLLQLASCVGFVVDIELLKGLDEMERRHHMLLAEQEKKLLPEEDFMASWKIAEAEGMVELSDTGLACKFSHDRVQQCAYELVPKGKTRELLHLRIGKYIRDKYLGNINSSKNDVYLFRAADQMNRGSGLMVQESERFELIRLNLKASQVARTQSGIEQVATYLQKAIACHEQTDDNSKWEVDYELILEVYSGSAEAEFSSGRFDQASDRIQTVSTMARDPADTIRARIVFTQMAGVQLNFQGALEESQSMLNLLGAKLPAATAFNIISEMRKTQRLLRGKSDAELTSLCKMTNERIRTIMYILYLASIYAFNADFQLAALIYLRMMQLTLQHGLCGWSPYAFVVYGLLLTGKGQYQEAFRLSQIAKQLQQENACFPAFTMMSTIFLWHLKQPFPECLEPSLRAYRVGLETGDIMSGGLSLSTYAVVYLMVGLPLVPLTVDLKRFGAQLRLFRLGLPLAYILPISQLALILTGQTTESMEVTWESIKQNHDCYDDNVSAGSPHQPPDIMLQYLNIFNFYLMKDTNQLEESVKSLLARKTKRLPGDTAVFNFFATFVDGLAGFELCRKRPKKRAYRKLAKSALKWLTFCTKKECVNCLGMLRLLEAEKKTLSSSCSIETGRRLYDEAISQLSRSGFTNLCAIANELAGEFTSSRGDSYWTEQYLANSMGLYAEWGASVKVEHMRSQHGFLKPPTNRRRSVSLRGRQRFEDTTISSSNMTNGVGNRPRAGSSDEMLAIGENEVAECHWSRPGREAT
ncbi:Histidine kinase [Seminavis robusta]|uniref:Histidine kinase n=1 Tax=Seminavis robusta TaxID=568900 RepID=A0A9N8H8M4_9STRA|nr:Histidine kinase [Seminavis robusta]|eukprot:Sro164_g073590.1 Histidine kinase (1095) ;mRNA; f:42492-45856